MTKQYSLKQRLAMGALVGATGLGVVGLASGFVSAHSGSYANNDGLSSSLSEKLNVSEEDVQTALDATRDEMHAQREAQRAERLQALVDSGDLTEEQKNLIEAKREELQAKREQERTELEAWAEENDIDMSLLVGRGERGERGPHHMDDAPAAQ